MREKHALCVRIVQRTGKEEAKQRLFSLAQRVRYRAKQCNKPSRHSGTESVAKARLLITLNSNMKAKLNLFQGRWICALALGLGSSFTRADPTFSDANWISMNPNIPGANDYVYAAAVDNSGQLYIGGDFTLVGDVIANGIANWDGSHWSALGSGVNGYVATLAVSGSNVYVGGDFTAATNSDGTVVKVNFIARWDGSRWSALGSGLMGAVTALAVSGGEVYAGGAGIYKWSGSQWSRLDSGLGGGGGPLPGPEVAALAGSGSNVYAGGYFTTVINRDGAAVAANCIAKWDGTRWTALGSGIVSAGYPGVTALAVSGSNLYAGGIFTTAGGSPANCVARWDGNHWSAVGSSVYNSSDFPTRVYALATLGSNVYVGGQFAVATNSGGGVVQANSIAKWDGSNWSALGTGVAYDWWGGTVYALAVSDSNVYAGGLFRVAGTNTADNIAQWNGKSWTALGSGTANQVVAMTPSGTNLYAAGTFMTPGNRVTNSLAKWNGSVWTVLNSGDVSSVHVMAVSGNDIYVAGDFRSVGGIAANSIAKWDGASWSALGSGLSGGDVLALAVCCGDLYAGGSFNVAGGKAANSMAKWDGTNWTALGLGPSGGASWPSVAALAVSGGIVYAAGYFSTTGGPLANTVAKWNGSQWTDLNLGTNAPVIVLAASGSDLYAGGSFTSAGGKAATNIAKWDGSSWSALGSGVNGTVNALAIAGSNVYVGGYFTTAGGSAANYIAKWDGSRWSALGSGMGGANYPIVNALVVSGAELFVAGRFTTAGGKVSPYMARAYLLALPELSVLRSGASVKVSWPSAATEFSLEQTSSLTAPVSWLTNTASASDDGTKMSVTFPATSSPHFFRLRRP